MKQFLFIFYSIFLTGTIFGQRTISGVVTDKDSGEPLIGATIQIQGTPTGTVTDFDGSYFIEANEGDILEISYVGYQSSLTTVGVSNVIDIALANSNTLEEVVVVGYGQQKKESVVGAVSQTEGEELEQRTGGSDLRNALTGLLPGVVTLQSSGVPGGGISFEDGEDDDPTQILIRGLSTWNGNGGPLILVDGVERTMQDIDPNQVEKMSILKDASATAVFGVKGANGVILITTKRGKEGKPKLTFETTQSFSTISRIHRVLDAPSSLRIQNNAVLHEVAIKPSSWSFYTPEAIIDLHENQRFPSIFPNTDWYDETTNDWARAQKYNLNVSGGTSFVKYFGSLSYLREGDVLRTEDLGQGYDPNFQYDRTNFRSNLDFNITPSTTFSVNLAGYYGQTRRSDGDKFQFWKGVYGMPPTAPIQFEDGTWSNLQEFDRFDNSVQDLNFGGVEKENRIEVNTDFILNQKLDGILPGLSFNARVAFDNLFFTRGKRIADDEPITKYIDPRITMDPRFNVNMSDDELRALVQDYEIFVIPSETTSGYNYVKEPFSVIEENVNNNAKNQLNRSLFYQASINYAQTFGDVHNVSGLALFNRRENARGTEFTNYREDWVGRITYDYDSRYLFEANAAYNGSEKFDREFRFGFFPSIAVGWVVSNESFFQNITSVVNKLKFRYSNGIVGNDQGIDRWLYVGGYDIPGNNWQFGEPFIQDSPYPWRLEGTIPNPVIQWETSQKQNIGVEVGLFNSEIQITADYFWEDRTDMFLEANDRNVPIVFGAPPVGVNAGRVEVSGYELAINFSKFFQNGMGLFANYNIAFVKDEILFREDPELTPDYQKQAGYQIGQSRSQLNQPGFIDSWDDVYNGVGGNVNIERLPGDFLTIDYNADGIIDPDDEVPYGYPARPQYTYGFTLGGSFKGFSLSVQFYGVFNVNYNLSYGEFFSNNTLVYEVHRDEAWSPEAGNLSSATLPHLRFDTGSGKGQYWLNDKAYLKLQNAELSYTIPSPFTKKLGLQGARIFVTGNNLAIWSDMLEDRDRPRASNRDYPIMRRLNAGMNVSF